jgi:hypothetical protein
MVNARSKIVFQTSGEENLRPLALDLFMGAMSPDKIKHELYSTKVMGYVEDYRTAYGRSTSHAEGRAQASGSAWGAGSGGTEMYPYLGNDPMSVSQSTSEFASQSSSESRSSMYGTAESESHIPMLIPIMGKELSSVQFEILEEQLFRAMAVLHDQEQRHCLARVVGQRLPVPIFTPEINAVPQKRERLESFTKSLLEKWSFALPMAEAQKRLMQRHSDLNEQVLNPTNEAMTARRKVAAAPEPIQTNGEIEPVKIRRKVK